MYTNKIRVKNFGLSRKSTQDLKGQQEQELSLSIEGNNGKSIAFFLIFDKHSKSSSNSGFLYKEELQQQ